MKQMRKYGVIIQYMCRRHNQHVELNRFAVA